MKTKVAVFIFFAHIFIFCAVCSAAHINGLYNTGVDDYGNALTAGTIDAHYTLAGPSSPAYATDENPAWVPAPLNSSWIGPVNAAGSAFVGTYNYSATFDLSGFDISTAYISGKWASDNHGYIYLNNMLIDNNIGYEFTVIRNFYIDQYFVEGENTLTFTVVNYTETPNPTGLLVFDIMGEVQEFAPAPIPEPATILFFLAGLLIRKLIKK
ncbi:MAG: hypothetical protein AB1454_12440 [Candidatus Auribacterota bacterium]